MYKQTEILFDQPRGQQLAEIGMDLAVESANENHEKWSDRCWQLFWHWLNKKPKYTEFMIEEFREHVYKMDLLEKPPSDRAFGFISKRAMKQDLIIHGGMRKVKNIRAHATPANVWIKK